MAAGTPKAKGPQGEEQALGRALQYGCEFPFTRMWGSWSLIRHPTPETATRPSPAPRRALTIEVHVLIRRLCLGSPGPLLCLQLCNDGIKEGHGLGHICAELGVFLQGCSGLDGKGGKEHCVSQPPSTRTQASQHSQKDRSVAEATYAKLRICRA